MDVRVRAVRPEALRVPVVVVDRSPVIRSGIKAVLETSGRFLLVGETADVRSLARPLAIRRGLIIIDARLAAESGFQSVRQAKIANPNSCVLLLSDDGLSVDRPDVVWQAMTAGADGYLFKDCSSNLLLGAALAVMNGGIIVARGPAWRIVKEGLAANGLIHAMPHTSNERRQVRVAVGG